MRVRGWGEERERTFKSGRDEMLAVGGGEGEGRVGHHRVDRGRAEC